MTKDEYLLVHLMEECSEVQKACSKMLRFGKTDENIVDLWNELDDVKFLASQLSFLYKHNFTEEEEIKLHFLKLKKQHEKLCLSEVAGCVK